MKWDFAIGNPPYQASNDTYNRQPPVYTHFYDAAQEIADNYMLISPARFLFNAGLTPKDWNEKMLSDEHIKVEYYNSDAAEIFPNTDIKGGVAVLYRDAHTVFGAIDEFIQNDLLRGIARRVVQCKKEGNNLTSIIIGGRSDLKFNKEFIQDYPQSVNDRLKVIQAKHKDVTILGPNEEYELKSSTFDVLPYVFLTEDPCDTDNYYKLFGLANGKRAYRWIAKKYMTPRYPKNNNIESYKAFIPSASGNGQFGETLAELVVGGPGTSSTTTFLSVGSFNTKVEAENAIKYIKTKFVRALFSVRKVTHHIVPDTWAYVPLQNFKSSSDIDWSVSISNIDKQLYKKYELSQEEIDFIENNVKEME